MGGVVSIKQAHGLGRGSGLNPDSMETDLPEDCGCQLLVSADGRRVRVRLVSRPAEGISYPPDGVRRTTRVPS
jgi:hypothetical protein